MSTDHNINERLAKVELDVSRLKSDFRNMDNTVSEGGYIQEAFEIIVKEVNEVRTEVRRIEQKFDDKMDGVNNKLDIILQHLTGINPEEK